MTLYRDISIEEVEIIKDVWERNRKYHEEISKFSKDIYSKIKFEDKINSIKAYNSKNIKITISEGKEDRKLLGYCISTFSGRYGEPQTLHVIEEARGNDIGKELMNLHIKWLKENGCEIITLMVSYENIKTIKFYENMGFKPNTLEMRLNY